MLTDEIFLDACSPVDTSACSSCRRAVEPLRTHEQKYEVAIMDIPAHQRMINSMVDHTPDVASPPPPPPDLRLDFALDFPRLETGEYKNSPNDLMPFDFAHLKTGQYKNSPNAWKLPTQTAH